MISKEGSTKFKNTKVVVHISIAASLKTSLEKVVESFVSLYENYFNSSRQLNVNNALNEMIISDHDPAFIAY